MLAGLRDAILHGGQPGESLMATRLNELQSLAAKQKVESDIAKKIANLTGEGDNRRLHSMAQRRLAACNALSNIAEQELACRGLLEILTMPNQGPASMDAPARHFDQRLNRLTAFKPRDFVQDWTASLNSIVLYRGQVEERMIKTTSESIMNKFNDILKMKEKPHLQLHNFKELEKLLDAVRKGIPEGVAVRVNVDAGLYEHFPILTLPEEPAGASTRTGTAANTPRRSGFRSSGGKEHAGSTSA